MQAGDCSCGQEASLCCAPLAAEIPRCSVLMAPAECLVDSANQPCLMRCMPHTDRQYYDNSYDNRAAAVSMRSSLPVAAHVLCQPLPSAVCCCSKLSGWRMFARASAW